MNLIKSLPGFQAYLVGVWRSDEQTPHLISPLPSTQSWFECLLRLVVKQKPTPSSKPKAAPKAVVPKATAAKAKAVPSPAPKEAASSKKRTEETPSEPAKKRGKK